MESSREGVGLISQMCVLRVFCAKERKGRRRRKEGREKENTDREKEKEKER